MHREPDHHPPAATAPAQNLHPELRTATVVVVDDERANVALLERILRAAGVADVHPLTDPREAVSTCIELAADLLLLDLMMPHMDGFAVMSALNEALGPDTFLPVLVLTADNSTLTRDRALMAGAKDFVAKPFDRAEVVLRVRNLLETRKLYVDVQRHNAALQADLDAQREEQRRKEQEDRERRQRIDQLIAGDDLRMVFQPIVDLTSRETLGVEALSRFDTQPAWTPDRWFNEAAAVGRGAELELAAIEAALSQLPQLPSQLFMSVNVSPSTALTPQLEELLEPASERIVLELTEHTRVDDPTELLATLAPIRALGTRIAVDDAGAGYAGLRQILQLRPDIIKLDTDLTRGIDQDPARRALSTAMVAFANEIDATIIAEGIETSEELDTLRAVGINSGQGYHLARPGPLPF